MDDQANGNVSDKKTRHRSPNYPAVGLNDAVDRLQKLYAKDGRAGAPAEIAAVHIGFGKAHGQAMSVLSALKKFGLVSEVNGRIAPTQRGLEIVNLTVGDARRAKALRDAVMEPPIYRELIEQHKDTGWPSDEALSSELVTYKGFNPNAAPSFVTDLKASLEYAGLSSTLPLQSEAEGDTDMETAIEHSRPDPEIAAKQWAATLAPTPVPGFGSRHDVFSLNEGEVVVQWPASLSAESYEDLSAWIDILKRKIGRSVAPVESKRLPIGDLKAYSKE